MPAHARPGPRPVVVSGLHRAPRAVIVEDPSRNHRLAQAKAPVGFLQGDHVGIDLAQDRQDAIGITPPVKPDALVDVVAGNLEFQCRLRPPRYSGRSA